MKMVKQYVGARYVPKFASPLEWAADTSYEALTIVTFNNASYTSKIQVPPTVGNPANNPKYWALTGNYNAQVEQYRQVAETIGNNLNTEIKNLKNADTTEITNRKNADTALQGQITTEITKRETADSTLQNNIGAEATARQTANNILQGNIISEAATRASADSNLQSQINQIVAPSGEAPSAAEVQNARIGADGVTYDTLGTAIRTQVNNLNNDINNKAYKVNTSGFYAHFEKTIDIFLYGIDDKTGVVNNLVNRAHTDFITPERLSYIIPLNLADTILINVTKYSLDGTYIGYEKPDYVLLFNNDIILSPNYKYRIVFKYVDNRDIGQSDLLYIKNNVTTGNLPIWYEMSEYAITNREMVLLSNAKERTYPFSIPLENGGIASTLNYYSCKHSGEGRTRTRFPIYLYAGEQVVSKNNNLLLYAMFDEDRKNIENTSWNETARGAYKIGKNGWYMLASNAEGDTIFINREEDRTCAIISDSVSNTNIYLSGDKKIDLKADFLTDASKSPQGIAIHNNYAFQFFTDNYIRVFDLNVNKLLYSIKADDVGHGNQMQFYGNETDTGFPLLYVSDGEENFCYVLKISLNSYEIVKTYKFDEQYGYLPQVSIQNDKLYTCCVSTNNAYDTNSKFIITAYDLTQETEDSGYITITNTNTFEIPYQGVLQGTLVINGNMYISCNTWSETNMYITIVNLEDKKIIRKIKASKLYNSELEGLCAYDNEQNHIIYSAGWYDNNDRYYKVIQLLI